MKKTLRLVLGDQLNIKHSWFEKPNEEVSFLLMELKQETAYVNHHIQKVVAFFLAMRAFAEELKEAGHRVIYISLDDSRNAQSFLENIQQIVEEEKFKKFEYQFPDEYRLDQELQKITKSLSISSETYDSEHFYTQRYELKEFFTKKKSKRWLMESFYREMRKKHEILIIQNEQPEGGKWNYDHSNRKKLPKNHTPVSPKLFSKKVKSLVELLENQEVKTIGRIDETHFIWPTTREESLELLAFFLKECLPRFGDFQDAMATEQWSVYHSRLSFSMNVKLLSPQEVIQAAIKEYSEKEEIDISQVEGFVRQILGWREYMRGIYWAKMPEYEKENQLKHTNSLPDFFWTGKTKMNCVRDAVNQSLNYAYAHHIQRLMITGNFALLAGVSPDEVDKWYLGIYIDAIQWVELPNTRGMSQWADGGTVATKPYVSSANYIHKMSNYCTACYYNKAKRTGEKSCPFNSLYWNFIDKNLDVLKTNGRMNTIIANWNRQESSKKADLLKQAEYYLNNVEDL